MAKKGRPRKPLEKHRADGTFRADRHSRKEVKSTGEPYQIGELDEHGLDLWNRIVPELVKMKIATAIDSPQLFAMCDWWSEYRKFQTDKRMEKYKRVCSMAAAYKQFATIASKFGLTAVDRASLEIDKTSASNPFLALIRS